MRIFVNLLLWGTFMVAGNVVRAQGDPLDNPILLSHYSQEELLQLKETEPDKFNQIVYYYTKSFRVEPIPGASHDLFPEPTHVIDINAYEGWRNYDEYVSIRNEKIGWIIVLLPESELVYPTPYSFKPLVRPLR